MAITKDSARQEVVNAKVAFTFADFTSGTDMVAIDLPANAIMISGALVIDTVFNSVTSDTITVGDTDATGRYKTGINGASAALTALVPTGTKLGVGKSVVIKWTGVGTAPTTGAGRLIIQYMVDGRAEFSQG